jgi:PAS domain S-box-containing protein
VGISWKRSDLGSSYHLNATFRQILNLPELVLPDFSPLVALLHPEDLTRQTELSQQIESGKLDEYTVEQRYLRKDGKLVWGALSIAVVRDQLGQVAQHIGILEDITARKKAERELADTYKNLVDVSRTAGMAEVATGVLHNVGNVLNSLNISASVISEGLRQSRAESLGKLAALIHDHSTDLGNYLTGDPKGKRVPEYIDTLASHFLSERNRLLTEIGSLQHSVDHIREIISMQQAYATRVTTAEPIDPAALMEDALHMNSSGLARHDIRIIREFETNAPVLVEKAKAIQILINLISNAKQACTEAGAKDKTITLGIKTTSEGRIRLSVRDTGVGIPAENLTRIFAHGFTTKATGHGFGLHSSANAAREMQGSLNVLSEGKGHGATFVLELPVATAPVVSVSAA